MIKLIIFDYDGVIVDSFSNVYNVYKKMCERLGVESPKDIERFRSVYGYNFYECYKNLGFPKKHYKRANNIFLKEVLREKPKLFHGFKNVLNKLSKKYTLILLSFNNNEEVRQKLKKFKIDKYFSFYKGNPGNKRFFKSEFIKKLIKKYKVKSDEVILIGDRDIDYNIGRKIGLKNILLVDYGWGHHKIIKKELIIKKPVDILRVIKNFE